MHGIAECAIQPIATRMKQLPWKLRSANSHGFSGFTLSAEVGPFIIELEYSPSLRRLIFGKSPAAITISIYDTRIKIHHHYTPTNSPRLLDSTHITERDPYWNHLFLRGTEIVKALEAKARQELVEKEKAIVEELMSAISSSTVNS